MARSSLDAIIADVAEKLHDIPFAFIGSVNLYIQGLSVEPRDVDILTTPEDIRKIDEILGEHRTKDIYFDESDGRNSYRSFYNIGGVEIEVLGNVSNSYREPDSLDRRSLVEFHGISVPCISLTDELNAYTKMGRTERAVAIRDFLNNSH